MSILFILKASIFIFSLTIIIGVIYTWNDDNNTIYYKSKKKNKIQSPNLEGINNYEKTYIFLGGKK